jgi:hypothetical protein
LDDWNISSFEYSEYYPSPAAYPPAQTLTAQSPSPTRTRLSQFRVLRPVFVRSTRSRHVTVRGVRKERHPMESSSSLEERHGGRTLTTSAAESCDTGSHATQQCTSTIHCVNSHSSRWASALTRHSSPPANRPTAPLRGVPTRVSIHTPTDRMHACPYVTILNHPAPRSTAVLGLMMIIRVRALQRTNPNSWHDRQVASLPISGRSARHGGERDGGVEAHEWEHVAACSGGAPAIQLHAADVLRTAHRHHTGRLARRPPHQRRKWYL